MNAEKIIIALRGVAKLHSIEEGSMVANLCIVASDLIESLLSQLDATIAGQETLQKALAESQRREMAAVEDLKTANFCSQCRLFVANRCGGLSKRGQCHDWQWRGPEDGE